MQVRMLLRYSTFACSPGGLHRVRNGSGHIIAPVSPLAVTWWGAAQPSAGLLNQASCRLLGFGELFSTGCHWLCSLSFLLMEMNRKLWKKLRASVAYNNAPNSCRWRWVIYAHQLSSGCKIHICFLSQPSEGLGVKCREASSLLKSFCFGAAYL